MTEEPDTVTQELEKLWLDALTARQGGLNDKARKLFKKILHSEPRLAEPRLELGHMDIEAGHLEDAEEQVRLAVDALDRGGQWIDDLEPKQLQAFAHNLLGEILFLRADECALDPDRARFTALWNEAADAFTRAYELDPENPDAKGNSVHCRRIEEEKNSPPATYC